ncbi:MAG: hypothetical protein DRH90_20175 [Deltaproteobacteria bacterium]|nr:MAG: hypothetical protein DRH90_20175 [Deltaproteobacteria bacterium]RLC11431.1 MAG: hypothetical protein DRI24_18795 [Deltaproteobacteria bacterium]
MSYLGIGYRSVKFIALPLIVSNQNKNIAIAVELVSKSSIGFKIKARRGVQPQAYIGYVED